MIAHGTIAIVRKLGANNSTQAVLIVGKLAVDSDKVVQADASRSI